MWHLKRLVFCAAVGVLLSWLTFPEGGHVKIFGTVQTISKGVSDHPFLSCWWAKSKEEFEAELIVSLSNPRIQKVWVPVPY